MAGWFIHLDVARKAIDSLAGDPQAVAILADAGATLDEITAAAHGEPAYLALGAIGPDIFFLLPDFKPPVGSVLWTAAYTIREIYGWLDEHLLAPIDEQLGPVFDNFHDTADALSGGLLGQLGSIATQATQFMRDALTVVAVRQYDLLSLLSSGVPKGFDEETFFWSDMLHYRQTYRVGVALWQRALAETDPTQRRRFQAYALGWMAHLGTDVITHTFVNQKVGGPYRLHWSRHHLVENHMDARVYNAQRGGEDLYANLSSSALHLWVAFNPDGSSRVNCFDFQPGPTYATGGRTPDRLDRQHNWDVDPDLPDELPKFLAETLRSLFVPALEQTPMGQEACCPTIISDLDDRVPIEGNGFPTAEDIKLSYWYTFHYMKWVTTDYYNLRPPEAPPVVSIPPFPSPPGAGAADPGPGPSDRSFWDDLLEALIAIFAWIIYLGQVVVWALTIIPAAAASAATYPLREVLYETVQLPLYNAWLAMHYYLAMTGFVMPLPEEINIGLTRLGISVTGSWPDTLAALDLVDGGLISPIADEPSGLDRQARYPKDAVLDAPSILPAATALAGALTGTPLVSSEFLHPWQFPVTNVAGAPVPPEHRTQTVSPYRAMTDVLDVLASMPGSPMARDLLESARSEAQTVAAVATLFTPTSDPAAVHTLGDPIDYVRYLMARLTRTGTDGAAVANFNLDADRGYGTLAWDWVRKVGSRDVPDAFKDEINPTTGVVDDVSQRAYRIPNHPGFGAEHGSYAPTTPGNPVQIRYIDREPKDRP